MKSNFPIPTPGLCIKEDVKHGSEGVESETARANVASHGDVLSTLSEPSLRAIAMMMAYCATSGQDSGQALHRLMSAYTWDKESMKRIDEIVDEYHRGID